MIIVSTNFTSPILVPVRSCDGVRATSDMNS